LSLRYEPKGHGFPNSFRSDRDDDRAAEVVAELAGKSDAELAAHCTAILAGIWADAEKRKREILAEHPLIETQILMRHNHSGKRGPRSRRWIR
jgi:hypothetical protein